ncbi:MAG: hypothetical protein QNJ58_17640 [Desulfobacterales bacterium]|nr:hypothetical protein [Desulfobacterales bacterium]
MSNLEKLLTIGQDKLDAVNQVLTDPDNVMISNLAALVEKLGGAQAINAKASRARQLENLLARLKEIGSPYLADLDWLRKQTQAEAFIKMDDFIQREAGAGRALNQINAVTLEISALQYFPWIISQAKQAIANGDLMPGRFIRVRNMVEQEADNGDTLAVAAAMQILGASYVETLDTKGTDGSNIHLGGPETITGYFGGIGQPNDHPLKWAEEFLNYYMNYGVRQVLNINPGTVMMGYLMHKMGIDIEFKISVFMGNDNPLSVFWTLMAARLFSREDGSTSLIGFNLANSVNNETIRQANQIRVAFGLTDQVRFEHHITETYKSIVIQPYNRRAELVELAQTIPNISAKHEGGDPEVEQTREHPSDILDYFMPKADVESQGLMEAMLTNYLDKHEALNRTASAVVKGGVAVIPASNCHD